MNNNENKTNINWYPGHMVKTKRKISENINIIDIVYELVDARMPFSSKNKEIDSIIKNKPRILIMTKYDLCDTSETKKWITYYEKRGYKVVPLDLNKGNVSKLLKVTAEIMQEIDQKRIKKGLKTRKGKVIIIGIPNVGKSTLINRLVGKKVANVGNKPGVTKSLDWIRINKDLELLDTPGILWPKLDNQTIALNLASLTAIKEEILPLDEVAIYILTMLNNYYPDILKERYGIEKIDDDIVLTLEKIGQQRGCLVKGGEIDYDKVILIIINDVKGEMVKGITFDRYKGE